MVSKEKYLTQVSSAVLILLECFKLKHPGSRYIWKKKASSSLPFFKGSMVIKTWFICLGIFFKGVGGGWG